MLLQGLGDGQTLLIAEGAASRDPGALVRLISLSCWAVWSSAARPPQQQACKLLMAAAPPRPTAPVQTLTALGSKLAALGCGGDALSAGLVGRFLEACGTDLCVMVSACPQAPRCCCEEGGGVGSAAW